MASYQAHLASATAAPETVALPVADNSPATLASVWREAPSGARQRRVCLLARLGAGPQQAT
jgi:hypothetical protein